MPGNQSMSYRLFMAVLTVALSLSGSTVLHGTTLPNSYPLGDAGNGDGPLVDPHLNKWLSQHADQPSPFEFNEAAFQAFVSKQDPVTGLFLKLEWALRSPADAGLRQIVDEGLKLVPAGKKEPSSPKKEIDLLAHPLSPFLLMNLVKSRVLTPEESSLVLSALAQAGGRTCIQKQMILDEMTSENLATLAPERVRDLLTRIGGFRSAAFKKGALRRVLGNIPEGRQTMLAPLALNATQPFPGILNSTPWLKAYAEKKGKISDESQLTLDFEELQQTAARGQCQKARAGFDMALARIKDRKDQTFLETALNTSKAIDSCLKQHEPRSRAEYLGALAQQLNEIFGFRGWSEARLRLAYVYWSLDQFENAKVIFEDVRRKIDGGETGEPPAAFKVQVARAVYSLGKIAENEGDADKAAGYYRDYVRLYLDQANSEEVLMALVLIHADKGDWSQAMPPVESIISSQMQLTLDERSVSAMSFALFWGGRIHLEQGRLKEAAEMWRRVASEYYSTYYGAMGHYLLEELTGHRLLIQPWRNPPFQLATYLAALSPEDRVQMARAQALLRIGMKAGAACELEEIDLSDGNPQKRLLKAMVLHASGQLLEAVKAYDSLPRSLRNTLASGFERVLFPRKYYDEVRSLAKKAEVDPDLVMAIIRQESVFNPMARSPVGAVGLMQLMPATALLESKRLSPGYLSTKERQEVRLKAANPMNLLEAETNLTLGVHHVRSLFARYNSPVYVLAAYNASPAAAQRWMTSIPTKDVLSFIERIPYKETRAYVKVVLRNYFYYKRWYGQPDEAYKHLDIVAQRLVAMVRESGKNGPITNH